jgi:hypothetical protein
MAAPLDRLVVKMHSDIKPAIQQHPKIEIKTNPMIHASFMEFEHVQVTLKSSLSTCFLILLILRVRSLDI